MSKDVKTQKQEIAKSSRKYAALAIVVILCSIGIMMNNSSEEDTTIATSKMAITEQEPVTEETSATEKPTIARISFLSKFSENEDIPFKIFVNDSKTPKEPTKWLNKQGIFGYVVQINNTYADIIVKAIRNSDIKIDIRGRLDNKNDELIEHDVNFTSLKVNNEEILPENITVWYEKPYIYTISAQANQEYKIHFEWSEANNQ